MLHKHGKKKSYFNTSQSSEKGLLALQNHLQTFFFILFSKKFDLCQFTVRQTEMQKFNALILHRSGRPTKNTLRVSGITVWDVTKEHIETPEFLSHIG